MSYTPLKPGRYNDLAAPTPPERFLMEALRDNVGVPAEPWVHPTLQCLADLGWAMLCPECRGHLVLSPKGERALKETKDDYKILEQVESKSSR